MSSWLDSFAVHCAPNASAVPDGIDGHPAVDEASLVQEAQTNAAAFTQLYQQYVERVYAYVCTRTRTEADAADLTQQVFLQALDGLSRYRGEGTSFAAWLSSLRTPVTHMPCMWSTTSTQSSGQPALPRT